MHKLPEQNQSLKSDINKDTNSSYLESEKTSFLKSEVDSNTQGGSMPSLNILLLNVSRSKKNL